MSNFCVVNYLSKVENIILADSKTIAESFPFKKPQPTKVDFLSRKLGFREEGVKEDCSPKNGFKSSKQDWSIQTTVTKVRVT